MRHLIIIILSLASGYISAKGATTDGPAADNSRLTTLRVEARLDYQRCLTDGNTVDRHTGFSGKQINIRLEGHITDNLSYMWRHRFNRHVSDGSFFDATDRLFLRWKSGRFSVMGGKLMVALGGWEYDHSSIDLYGSSVFWNNVHCYEIGASAAYDIGSSDNLMFQFCESPFFTPSDRNMYAYSLYWSGSHGIYSPLWSVNMLEYEPGQFINYIVAGNRLTLGKTAIELDFINRAASHQTFFFRDCSVIGELSYIPTDRWRFHAKMTYDINRTDTRADRLVLPGTELTMAGGGVEFYPFAGSRSTLRLHANAYWSWGRNANSADLMQDRTLIADIGVKWFMDILSFIRKK